MLMHEDILKWLQKSLSLKTEKGLKESIERLFDKLLDEEMNFYIGIKEISVSQQKYFNYLKKTNNEHQAMD